MMRKQRPQRPIGLLGLKDPRVNSRRRHGLSPTDVAAMLAAQDGKCALCGNPLAYADVNVDHSHLLAAIHDHDPARGCRYCRRSLLCRPCNLALGWFGDSPDRLLQAATYIREWHARLTRSGAR